MTQVHVIIKIVLSRDSYYSEENECLKWSQTLNCALAAGSSVHYMYTIQGGPKNGYPVLFLG